MEEHEYKIINKIITTEQANYIEWKKTKREEYRMKTMMNALLKG